jgi:hypothetical protein
LIVTVKGYPAVSKRYGEAVCVAGVRTDTPSPEWVRLFRVQYRDLPFTQRFKKYQEITLEASQHGPDTRPETYRPNLDTLELGDVMRSAALSSRSADSQGQPAPELVGWSAWGVA